MELTFFHCSQPRISFRLIAVDNYVSLNKPYEYENFAANRKEPHHWKSRPPPFAVFSTQNRYVVTIQISGKQCDESHCSENKKNN
jgi:hypothetical protein